MDKKDKDFLDIFNFNPDLFENEKNDLHKSYNSYNSYLDDDSLNYKMNILKFLTKLGVDTRFVSYYSKMIFMNNIRFSKFSKKKQETFKKHFPEIAIIKSTIFQKICSKASKIFAEKLSPKDNVLLLNSKDNLDNLLKIVIEPYSRKYGINILNSNFDSLNEAIFYLNQQNLNSLDLSDNHSDNVNDNYNKLNIDAIIYNINLNEKVETILAEIFSGNGIETKSEAEKFDIANLKIIHPFINISKELIYSFLESQNHICHDKKIQNENFNKNNYNDQEFFIDKNDYFNLNNENHEFEKNNVYKKDLDENKEFNEIAISFMEFLDDIIPQYKENILKSYNFLKNQK